MAPIRIKHVVSFSSQDPKSRVDNVCESSGAGRPWLCAALDRSGVLKAELQLERASTIGFIDVGNLGSAFIQVDVGRSSWPSNHPYVPLLPTATLMSPADSRQGKGRQGVRMFKKADFLPQAAKESWDRLRLTCTQPFNKKSQFGLSFLRLRTAEEQTEEVSADQEHTTAENQITPNKMISVSEWLTSPALQHTFFGQKTEEVSPGEAQKNHVLSRAERMVTAVQSVRRSLSIVPHNTLTSSPCQSEAKSPNSVSDAHSSGFISSGSKASTPVDRRRRSRTRQEQTSMASTPKRSRSAGCEKLASKCSQTSTPTRAATKKNIKTLKRCQSPVKTNTPAASPTQNIPHSPEPPESACPICGVSFSPLYLPFHASSCLDSGPVGFSGDMDSDILTSFPSPTSFGISRDEHMVPCPLCSLSLPIDCIEQHASTCGDTVWVD
ncbi:protein XNDC1N isoform X2 [Salminus brasiliensis]|uniref:protein XNDC1N isoform X2 n=1 Tax=Salminus brasiliensis TaxID=930266 RepID=UPI003B832418